MISWVLGLRVRSKENFFYNSLFQHFLNLIFHFLLKGKWYSVWGFSNRLGITGYYSVFYQIGAFEIVTSINMENMSVLSQNRFHH
jgi:hypothetical protein